MRHRRRKGAGLLLKYAVTLSLLIVTGVLGTNLFPTAYRLVRGEFYINPRVETRTDEVYSINIWIKLTTTPGSREAKAALKKAVTDVGLRYPNYELCLTFLDEIDAGKCLRQALAAGTPPDLYYDPDSSVTNYGELQVPVEVYFNEETKAGWPSSILAQASFSGRVCALPVTLMPRVLLVNKALWPYVTPGEASVESIDTWDDFLQKVAAVDSCEYGFVPTSTGREMLAALLASWGIPAPENCLDDLALLKEKLLRLAQGWQALAGNDKVPGGAPLDRDCLALFLTKKTAAIGPLNPQLVDKLWEMASEKGIIPEIRAMPSDSGHLDICSSSLILFRQKNYAGHRHTKAAYEFALELAPSLAACLAEYTKALPAPLALLKNTRLPFDPNSAAIYSDAEKALPLPYSGPFREEQDLPSCEKGLEMAWESLVNQQITAEAFATLVTDSLSTRYGP